MDQNQKRYAMGRITEALNVKVNALRARHTTKSKGPTDAEKLQAIRDGDVELRTYRITVATPLKDAFDFSSLGSDSEIVDEKAVAKERKEIESQAARVRDEIMLGDDKKAIQLIRSFCGD